MIHMCFIAKLEFELTMSMIHMCFAAILEFEHQHVNDSYQFYSKRRVRVQNIYLYIGPNGWPQMARRKSRLQTANGKPSCRILNVYIYSYYYNRQCSYSYEQFQLMLLVLLLFLILFYYCCNSRPHAMLDKPLLSIDSLFIRAKCCPRQGDLLHGIARLIPLKARTVLHCSFPWLLFAFGMQ